ncbi:c-type cytochrome [Amylibacter sp. SFDW26]|uniref:di-heme oxidoreductase family protein n=1 Tax=Amylibacter sp. SFDW26 TaxID=2652722 RepID=UPI001261C5FA|nr:di-heme oxidoredictase family protein [Amylibacter sp. SFDW26]KAB7615192.1 c-type cytochrome [Amylibacter sp. SFDW26]
MKLMITFLSLSVSVSAALALEPTLDNIVPRTAEEIERIQKITTPTDDFSQAEAFETFSAGAATVRYSKTNNAFSLPSGNIDFEGELNFKLGNALFRKLWVSSPSSTLASDGLGPLYNARSCQRCHLKDGRGHPPENADDSPVSLVMRLARPGNKNPYVDEIKDYLESLPDPTYGGQFQDFAIPGHAAEGRFKIGYTDQQITLSDGLIVTLKAPTYLLEDLAYGALHPDTVVAPRIAPQMIGLGLLEAIPTADIMANADPDDVNGDGISGRANIVYSRQLGDLALGRFGLKAHNATIMDQSSAAFLNDIGISSPLHPEGWGDCTDAQKACQLAPNGNTDVHDGVEISNDGMDLVNFYARNLGVPIRINHEEPNILRGKEVFYKSGCIACHTPKFVTNRLDNQDEQSFQLIWPYTDMLLHDMGEGLADNTTAARATGQEWRTPPLWGIGLTQQVSGHTRFLHDGRARNLLEAILWHGGEAETAKTHVVNLPKADRDALIQFLESL